MEFEMFDGGPEPQNDDFQILPNFSVHEQDNNNNNITQEPFITWEPDPLSIYIDPSEVDNRLNSLEDSDPRAFRDQETYPRPCAETEQNCPQKQRRSSVITTLKEASEGISIQPPQIQSKEFENIYPRDLPGPADGPVRCDTPQCQCRQPLSGNTIIHEF